MKLSNHLSALLLILVGLTISSTIQAQTGVGAKCPKGAVVYFDGTPEMLHNNWEYWEGPRFSTQMPIKWTIVGDPVNGGKVLNSNDPAAAGGKYGAADIVTKQKFRDFRLHVEFMAAHPGGNSGVYLQNRYEIQILDGDSTAHGMAAVINDAAAPYSAYNGTGNWNAYDIVFRAARFKDGKLVEKPLVTVYLNGKQIHTNQTISQVYGGINSGIDGGNDNGKGLTESPGSRSRHLRSSRVPSGRSSALRGAGAAAFVEREVGTGNWI
jgi:hypothetical protein